MNKQRGFTLIELLITVVVLGIVTMILTPTFDSLVTAQKSAYIEKHRMNNQLIAGSLIRFAADSTQHGRLPAPYTGAGYTGTVYDPSDASTAGTELTQALSQSGINPNEINDDAKASHKVRVYQLIPDLLLQIPLNFQSGPLVTVTYDFGAIYLTACPKNSGDCNPSAATGIPGTSGELNGTNYSTWTTAGTDGPATFVSSLPVQKQMLATTVQRMDKVRDALLSFLRAKQVTAAGGDKTNWFPNQAGLSSPGNLAGAMPGTNQGCRDGWFDLSSAAVSVLPAIGLAPDEFGKTAWGGPIQYCRDYDPTASELANAPPHYGAIRILSNVSAGAAPDAAVPGNNVVLTF